MTSAGPPAAAQPASASGNGCRQEKKRNMIVLLRYGGVFGRLTIGTRKTPKRGIHTPDAVKGRFGKAMARDDKARIWAHFKTIGNKDCCHLRLNHAQERKKQAAGQQRSVRFFVTYRLCVLTGKLSGTSPKLKMMIRHHVITGRVPHDVMSATRVTDPSPSPLRCRRGAVLAKTSISTRNYARDGNRWRMDFFIGKSVPLTLVPRQWTECITNR